MTQPAEHAICPQCGTAWAPFTLACPGCGLLVYAGRLKKLAEQARAATEAGDIPTALATWREALVLLPPDSKQHAAIRAKITELGQVAPTAPTRPAGKQGIGSRLAGGASALAVLAWKLKALLLGLTKATTLFSMLLSLGVYWAVWGWKFALGLVLSIYVHEMGHVFALRRFGFKATSPMFIPGFGALIRLQQQVVNPDEDAYIGLAGPVYGLGAAVASLLLWLTLRSFMKSEIFAVIAGVGAWINLFNLLPIYTLDGGRGFHAMNRVQKIACAIVVAGAWYFTQEGLLVLLALVCGYRAFTDQNEPNRPWRAAATYIALVATLSALMMVQTYGMVDDPDASADAGAGLVYHP